MGRNALTRNIKISDEKTGELIAIIPITIYRDKEKDYGLILPNSNNFHYPNSLYFYIKQYLKKCLDIRTKF